MNGQNACLWSLFTTLCPLSTMSFMEDMCIYLLFFFNEVQRIWRITECGLGIFTSSYQQDDFNFDSSFPFLHEKEGSHYVLSVVSSPTPSSVWTINTYWINEWVSERMSEWIK